MAYVIKFGPTSGNLLLHWNIGFHMNVILDWFMLAMEKHVNFFCNFGLSVGSFVIKLHSDPKLNKALQVCFRLQHLKRDL